MCKGPFDLDDFMGYLIVTDQVDETFALKEDSNDDKDNDDTEKSYPKTIGRWKDK